MSILLAFPDLAWMDAPGRLKRLCWDLGVFSIRHVWGRLGEAGMLQGCCGWISPVFVIRAAI